MVTICINGVAEVQLPQQAVETVLQNNPNAVLGSCPSRPISPVSAPSVDGVAEETVTEDPVIE